MSYLFKYYSKLYDPFMNFFNLNNINPLLNTLSSVSNLNIVDIGGGTGTLASKLIDLGAKVTIVDPEKNMTNIAKNKNPKIKISNNYSINMPIENSSIDIIVIRDCLHHISDHKTTLIECNRILKPDGKLIIQDFNKSHIITTIIFLFERLCFEKTKMISKDNLNKLTLNLFKNSNIVDISPYEFIYICEK
ncbi:hypothetical protein JCM1393_17200 [Clostridium carnis]